MLITSAEKQCHKPPLLWIKTKDMGKYFSVIHISNEFTLLRGNL